MFSHKFFISETQGLTSWSCLETKAICLDILKNNNCLEVSGKEKKKGNSYSMPGYLFPQN